MLAVAAQHARGGKDERWPTALRLATVQESVQNKNVDLGSPIGSLIVDTVRTGWAVTWGRAYLDRLSTARQMAIVQQS